MFTSDSFEISVDRSEVKGHLHRPKGGSKKKGQRSVLLCSGFPFDRDDLVELSNQMTTILVDAGVVTATYAPRLADLSDESLCHHRAKHLVEDALAVFEHVAEQPDLDRSRIAVLGYSSAAVVAACLAGRTDQIAGLCLVNPMTVADIVNRLPGPETQRAEQEEPPERAAFVTSVQKLAPLQDVVVYDRPSLVVHGASDRAVAPENSLSYFARLADASQDAEHAFIARGDHAFTTVEGRVACMEMLRAFLTQLPSRSKSAA